ncbi:MAG: hypothetical protein HY924_05195 [Elusimicrobia bacterium]|nr:hypothetical protein [Elusimicrobiota bacterium]
MSPRPPERGKVAVLVYEYGLGNSPALINAARALAESGYGVDLFTCRAFLGDLRFDDERIRVREIGVWGLRSLAHRGRFLASRTARRVMAPLPRRRQEAVERERLERGVSIYADSVSAAMGDTRYACLIGVEPLGLLAASLLGSSLGAPYVYYNLELHHGPDITTAAEAAAKEIEKDRIKGASFTITLDDERARLICSENGTPRDSMLTVPVCADGDAFMEKTDVLRRRLGLRPEDRIILYAGFLAEWAMVEELAESARDWPDDWVLVLHSHGCQDHATLKRLRRCEGGRVRLSLDPVPHDELAALLASADIGVALYRDRGLNFTLIGSASGKVAHYLRSGLPVIVNSYPAMSRVLDEYRCGAAIDGISRMPEAIRSILGDYQSMRSAAFRCYEERYRFSRRFSKVLERIDAL